MPFAGAGYKELSDNLLRAFASNSDIKLVLWGFDVGGLSQEKDWMRYSEYPSYLYDNNIFNDVSYVLNKEILVERTYVNVLRYTANPQTDFYFFFPPYSICYWDDISAQGKIEYNFRAMEYAAQILLPHDNVRLFEFYSNYDLICNLNNYKDYTHYREDINTQMLVWMRNGEYQLTLENYQDRFAVLGDFYTNFDYDAYFSAFDCFV